MRYVNGNKIDYVFDNNTVEQNFPVMVGSEKIIIELASALNVHTGSQLT